MKKLAIVCLVTACLAVPQIATAFCGFYVAGTDTELHNDATQVVLMRSGTRTVVSMQNNYRGPLQDFAMVVPVPEVLEEDRVKTLEKELFDAVDKLSAPRLVEYWEKDPCEPERTYAFGMRGGAGTGSGFGAGGAALEGGTVTVEAEFAVGEYDIVILSTDQASALEGWLKQNEYSIPEGAAPYFRPYVEDGSYFFVAKVNPKKVKFEDGEAVLSPLRFHYSDESFRLPVRLGLINSAGEQDLLIYLLGQNQRFELANYPNVTIPTNLEVSPKVKDSFGEFYEALFSRTIEENPKAFVTEYSWAVGNGKCDPCPGMLQGLQPSQLASLGADLVDEPATTVAVKHGRPTVEGGDLDVEIIRRVVRRHRREIQMCHQRGAGADSGKALMKFTIDAEGRVEQSKYEVADGVDPAVVSCVEKTLKGWRFPAPKDGTPVGVTYPIRAGGRFALPAMSGWILTRIHGRYSRDSLGEDLVFRKADPIVGGRQGEFEDQFGQNPSSFNNFQGRYIIRNEWDGPVECDNPKFGRWGGPPSGGTPPVRPAASRNTTGEQAKAASLDGLIRKGLSPGTKPAGEGEGTDRTDTEAAPGAISADNASCKCSTTSRSGWPFELLLGVFAYGFWRRRRYSLQ